MDSQSTQLCDLGQVQSPIYKMAMVILTLKNTYAEWFVRSLTCHRSLESKCGTFSIVIMIIIMTITDR